MQLIHLMLTDDQTRTAAHRALKGESFAAIGKDHGVSRERIRQIVNAYCEQRNPQAFLAAGVAAEEGNTRLIDALRAQAHEFITPSLEVNVTAGAGKPDVEVSASVTVALP